MKKFLLCVLLSYVLMFSAFADTDDYGYYDYNLDGEVNVLDVLSLMRYELEYDEDSHSLLRSLRVLKAASVCETLAATIVSVDSQNENVLISTEKQTNVSVPFSMLDAKEYTEDALDSLPVTVSMDISAKKVYAVLLGKQPDAPDNSNSKPISIKQLNLTSESHSHATDDIETASLERNYRESLELTSESTGYFRYDYAYYPRIKKVKDDLYLLLSMYGQIGTTLYYCTSADAVNWSEPSFLYRSIDGDLTYSGGSLDGVVDKYCAVNADAVVLDNGDIMCVYYMRPNKSQGRIEYPDLSGIFVVRGTVGEDNKITFGEHKKVYTGTGWEPFIRQRDDGRIEIYWTSDTYYMRKYGWDDNHRASCSAMIWSDDNGESWTPDVRAGDDNYYQGFGVFSQYLGTKAHTANPSLGQLPWFCAQMPSATGLYNGKTLLAAEVKTLSPTKFTIAFHTSGENGEWKENLQNGATTANSSYEDNIIGAGPYLATFPSGEVYLTYHNNSTKKFFGRLVSPDGSTVSKTEFSTAPSGYGMWSSCEIVSSHEVITAAQKLDADTDVSGIVLEHSYLNHRVNSNKFAVKVDGYTNEWGINTDALFVGSDSQAQSSVQIAYDKSSIYFLISVFDNMLTNEDKSVLYVSDENGTCYTVTVFADGSYTVCDYNGKISANGNGVCNVFGTVDNNSDVDEGALFEISVSRDALGLALATEFSFAHSLVNADGGEAVVDTYNSFDKYEYSLWPKVVLQ